MGKSRKPAHKRKDNRNRRMVSAVYDMDKPDEREVVEYNDEIRERDRFAWKGVMAEALLLYRDLKRGRVSWLQRLFPRIVDAIRLYEDLADGSTSVMRELFPERFANLRLAIQSDLYEQLRHDEQRDLMEKLHAIRTQLDNLEKLSDRPAVMQSVENTVTPIKAIGGNLDVPDPVFDDDDDLFTVQADTLSGQRAANNFLASIRRLND